MIVKDLVNKEYMCVPVDQKISLDSLKGMEPEYLIAIDEHNKVISKLFVKNSIISELIDKEHRHCSLDQLECDEKFVILNENQMVVGLENVDRRGKFAIVVDENEMPVGIIENVGVVIKIVREWKMAIFRFNLRLDYYKKIFNAMEEEIFITDEYGFILYLNPYAEKVCGLSLKDCIGKHTTDLEKEKRISTSITMEVLKSKKKVNILQKICTTGKTVLATAVPVFDEDGNFTNVISTSKDVEEINRLIAALEKKDAELDSKDREIANLKERIISDNEYILQSSPMKKVQELIMKVAPTDISVLIHGESGVGKEVVAELIHNFSSRHNMPFIKINCGLIPENLLESELFGYESGAFTGANKKGKVGKIELAHEGTLFFDEIGEMPLGLQVKLLEFLQDREFVRVGGTKRIPINTRVIAATNRELREMMEKGTFREDLFYRLSVMPILVQPLRNRVDDIIPLAEMFLKKFNQKHHLSKKFSPEVLQYFCEYAWPGNVRELMNVIERLMVVSDSNEINREGLMGIISNKTVSRGSVICTDLLPLKEAKKELEYQLVTKAYEKYNSTTKAGAALEIDQSTVVKIMKRHRGRSE